MCSAVQAILSQIFPASVWSLPNFWNTALSGFFVVGFPVFLRYVYFRPKLAVGFTGKFDVSSEPIAEVISRTLFNAKLDVRNSGAVTLTNPRIWCLGVVINSENKLRKLPVTPFELNWTNTSRDFQIGAVFPGNFGYEITLISADGGLVGGFISDDAMAGKAFIPRRDGDINNLVLLQPGIQYEICLVISNDNILVPAHFVHLRVDWMPGSEKEDASAPQFNITKISEGDFHKARRKMLTSIFEEG